MESLIMTNCYGIGFRSWRKELRTREKTKQTPCKLPDRVSRSLQGVLFKVYQISVLILLKKILFSFFSVCLPLFIRHIAAMLLRKTSSKTMQTVTNILKSYRELEVITLLNPINERDVSLFQKKIEKHKYT